MSLTANLQSPVLKTTPSNRWVAGDSIQTMLPMVNDIVNIAAQIDSQLSPAITSSTAINSTATATAAQVSSGLITSTSAAPVTITLPTATQMATQLGATQGGTFEFVVDNSAGANTVTIAGGSGMTIPTPAITGGNTLTISTANVYGRFALYFTSTTTCTLSRIV